MNWKTVLVPHDFSPCADAALHQATDLARFHGARLVLLHVSHVPSTYDGVPLMAELTTEAMAREHAQARAAAGRTLEALAAGPRAAGVPVEVRATTGDVAAQILAAAADTGADLIVMGTHGKTGLTRLVLGSMTEQVLRQAPVPVLTLRDRGA